LAISDKGGTVRVLETASGKERARFTGHGGDVTSLAFTPDGRRLASGSRDTTILVWDVTGRLQDRQLRPARLSSEELAKHWADLAADDAKLAGRTVWSLEVVPSQAVHYLTERLQNAAADTKARLAKVPQLLRDLDDNAFAIREKAKAELARLGEAAEPALRQALAKSPSPEARRSLEQLLNMLQTPSVESLRERRAVEVLEHIGNRDDLKVLTAEAGTESILMQEIHAALARLARADRR
jgi:hypothetical protein